MFLRRVVAFLALKLENQRTVSLSRAQDGGEMSNKRWLGKLTKFNKAVGGRAAQAAVALGVLELVENGDFTCDGLALTPELAVSH